MRCRDIHASGPPSAQGAKTFWQLRHCLNPPAVFDDLPSTSQAGPRQPQSLYKCSGLGLSAKRCDIKLD
ncbi:MAG: hypothetical protein EBX59_10530, partial [Betaproteobacteria bacterium]|nr:hypothetical protein [Betaproteobacteria bacterium]